MSDSDILEKILAMKSSFATYPYSLSYTEKMKREQRKKALKKVQKFIRKERKEQ